MITRAAFFISPHGFGHAARASAVMAAMHEICPTIEFEIFTTIPLWFFEESLSAPFSYHFLLTDIGLVQDTPMHADLTKTIEHLDKFLPFEKPQIAQLAQIIDKLKCKLVICDIAPMGIMVAREAGIPSVLVENFTWDWVYQEYKSYNPRLNRHVDYLKTIFDSTDYHIQTEPICSYSSADLTTSPVSRTVKVPARQVREKLGIANDTRMVVITMGGVPAQFSFLNELSHQRDFCIVIPGGSNSLKINGNLILLPHHSDFFHPDLIMASNAVVGKVGYSTLAEIYHTGVPFGYIMRPNFRESEILAAYIENQMNGIAIKEAEFQDGGWVSHLPRLLALPDIKRNSPNGAEQIAGFLCNLLLSLYDNPDAA